MNTQEAFLQQLKKRLEGEDLLMTVDGDWANTGIITAHTASSLDGISVRYDFQPTYATFKVTGQSDTLAYAKRETERTYERALDILLDYFITGRTP